MLFRCWLISTIFFCLAGGSKTNACGVVTAAGRDTGDYPAHWWVNKSPKRKRGTWGEILPEDAGPGEVVISRRNELKALGNFGNTPVEVDGVKYPSVDSFWQMLKYPEGTDDERVALGAKFYHSREQIAQMSAAEANRYSKWANETMKRKGINWVTYHGEKMTYREQTKGKHYQLIFRVVKAKVEQNPEIKALLLQTAGLTLIPESQDYKSECPAWRYHEMLMEIREQLLASPAK